MPQMNMDEKIYYHLFRWMKIKPEYYIDINAIN